jgi:uncharacterized membrane protein
MDNRKLGRLMGYILLGAGIGHFIFPSGLDSIVPSALPGDPRIYTYLSGVAEILIGLALLSAPHIKVLGKPLKLWGAYGAFAPDCVSRYVRNCCAYRWRMPLL